MKNQAFPRNYGPKSGNALLICLITIALLGLLTAFLMRSSSKTSSNYTSEEADINATKIMRQAQAYEAAVNKLTSINRCSENEIDFTNTYTDKDYSHTPVSPDNHCKLFEVDGAGIAYAEPPQSALDAAESASADYGQWVFLGSQCVLYVGSGDAAPCADSEVELMLTLKYVREDVCLHINRLNSIPDETTSTGIPAAASDTASAGFVGTYAAAASSAEIGAAATNDTLEKHATGCFLDSNTSAYTFYHVILSR